jgi:hypothetical protein
MATTHMPNLLAPGAILGPKRRVYYFRRYPPGFQCYLHPDYVQLAPPPGLLMAPPTITTVTIATTRQHIEEATIKEEEQELPDVRTYESSSDSSEWAMPNKWDYANEDEAKTLFGGYIRCNGCKQQMQFTRFNKVAVSKITDGIPRRIMLCRDQCMKNRAGRKMRPGRTRRIKVDSSDDDDDDDTNEKKEKEEKKPTASTSSALEFATSLPQKKPKKKPIRRKAY